MSEIERIRDQLRRAYSGDAWHGPSLKEVLEGVDADTASARPIADAHSIRELVLHIVAWEKEAIRRVRGEGSDLPPEEDWPDGADAWTALLEELEASHVRLMETLAELDDSQLEGAVIGTGGTVYHLVHGVVQHNLYHGGQIVLLRRAASA